MSEFQFAKKGAPLKAALAAQLGGVAVIAALIFAVVGYQNRLADRAAEYRQTLEQRDAVLNGQSALDRSGDLFYVAESPQLAQAELADAVQALADAYDIQLEILQASDVERTADKVQLTLEVSGVVPEARLGDFLSALANARPVILVNDFNLRRARDITRQNAVRRVAFQLDLRGFMEN